MYQNITLTSSVSQSLPQAIVIALFEQQEKLPRAYQVLDEELGGSLSQAKSRDEFTVASGKVTCLYPTKGSERLYVIGLGSRDTFKYDTLRTGLGKVMQLIKEAAVTRVHMELAPVFNGSVDHVKLGFTIGESLTLANFAFEDYKGAVNATGKAKKLSLTVEVPKEQLKSSKDGATVGDATNYARTLAATPPNVANPDYIVKQCRAMSRKVGLKCSVIDAKKAASLNMGGLVAVGQGGSTPPALICMEHKPAKTKANSKPILLVGKAVTFDTGGYSLKPGGGMGMKYDKCGGMAVIGAMQAIASLKLNVHVVGLVPTAENMVDTVAYRPNDIVTFFNGVTAEVTNTDAEGRLILADALAYGTKTYKPQAVIDLATLTGGVVVALGSFCAGAFVNDTKLHKQVFDAGETTGERLWRLPLWQEHRDMLKGIHSDIVNSCVGVREAHPIQGAAFLSFFVGDEAPTSLPKIPWAHLDIAGTADSKDDKLPFVKGPTGFGVRLLTEMISNWQNI
jgi:leucyl aminopeptidase